MLEGWNVRGVELCRGGGVESLIEGCMKLWRVGLWGWSGIEEGQNCVGVKLWMVELLRGGIEKGLNGDGMELWRGGIVEGWNCGGVE